jgi:hypothetical protein
MFPVTTEKKPDFATLAEMVEAIAQRKKGRNPTPADCVRLISSDISVVKLIRR